jgi:hypothetical protein
VISSETFLTIRQVARWYFFPEGVLKNDWAFNEREIENKMRRAATDFFKKGI